MSDSNDVRDVIHDLTELGLDRGYKDRRFWDSIYSLTLIHRSLVEKETQYR